MNDFERKLSQQPFRSPPADLRAAIFDAEPPTQKIVAPPAWTWRDWFWPAPQAWAALAALWLIFAAISFGNRQDQSILSAATAPDERETPASNLLTYHHQSDWNHVLDLAN